MATYTWRQKASLTTGAKAAVDLNMTSNLVDPEWENLDPTPDIHSMFKRFDDRFFQSKLQCVELEWSKRMYSCAGICYSRRNRMGHSVIIRLSEPLLKLRPRKNLVETLLHEMIHAFSFIRGIREGNGGHGPFFCQMMNDINKAAGTNITVYHTFHDEVEVYKKHVWRCNGVCSNRKPFFGYIRRTSNRAPGPNDFWWKSHKDSCGGYFEKISEPEKEKKSSGKSKAATTTGGGGKRKEPAPMDRSQPKIKDLFARPATTYTSSSIPTGGSSSFANPSAASAGPRRSQQTTAAAPTAITSNRPPAIPGSNNIRGFSSEELKSGSGGGGKGEIGREVTSSSSARSSPPVELFKGTGNLLSAASDKELQQFRSVQDQVRSMWLKRMGGAGGGGESQPTASSSASASASTSSSTSNFGLKRQKLDDPSYVHQWQLLDDDIAIRTPYVETIDLVDSEPEAEDPLEVQLRDHNEMLTQMANKTVQERQSMIRQELFENDEGDGSDEDGEDRGTIELIDDEFDDTKAVPGGGGGVTGGLFGVKNEVGGGYKTPSAVSYSAEDVVRCPICEGGVSRGYLAEHIESGCLGITQKVNFVFNKKDKEIRNLFDSSTTASRSNSILFSPPRASQQAASSSSPSAAAGREELRYPCPNCGMRYSESRINEHLDQCLS